MEQSHDSLLEVPSLVCVCVIFSFTGVWNLNLKNHHKWVSSQQMEKETLHEDLATDGVSMKAGGDSLGNRILYGVTVNKIRRLTVISP